MKTLAITLASYSLAAIATHLLHSSFGQLDAEDCLWALIYMPLDLIAYVPVIFLGVRLEVGLLHLDTIPPVFTGLFLVAFIGMCKAGADVRTAK